MSFQGGTPAVKTPLDGTAGEGAWAWRCSSVRWDLACGRQRVKRAALAEWGKRGAGSRRCGELAGVAAESEPSCGRSGRADAWPRDLTHVEQVLASAMRAGWPERLRRFWGGWRDVGLGIEGRGRRLPAQQLPDASCHRPAPGMPQAVVADLVEAGREYIEAYVSYMHYVENLMAAAAGAGGEEH